MIPPALVFNCHYNGLSIIQELGRHGVPVYALDTWQERGHRFQVRALLALS
jgi:hypothetical protein